ncbi:hypothetical protein SAMN06265337_1553 [Hymenobacter gelipurpurascens]|uniref:Uncharacterized protein n=1 Tax=Hymenobacter gelipurpurascens TaxID=89968 RepID=A0A212TKA9_9BACT|nr:hypothetical protein [Hymenobacter gelipurpurascens]SNC66266.1 hypothetical protein SAMN06265337_1553 [Hymenobacter gelipurpurascens]
MSRLGLAALCFLLVLRIAPALGQCESSPWVGGWPSAKTETIQPRQTLLIDAGFSPLALEIQKIGHATEVSLWSAHDSVLLVVKDRIVHPNNTIMLLLQPSRSLLLDSVYELRARNDDENLYWIFQNGKMPKAPKTTNYRWRVAAVPDTQAPIWHTTPAVVKKVFSDNSEGTENYVLFSCPLSDTSPYFIKATVHHLRSGLKSTTYMSPWEGQLALGWFTCSGDFRFSYQEDCTVLFEAIDAAGNRSTASGQPIPFQAPVIGPTPWH